MTWASTRSASPSPCRPCAARPPPASTTAAAATPTSRARHRCRSWTPSSPRPVAWGSWSSSTTTHSRMTASWMASGTARADSPRLTGSPPGRCLPRGTPPLITSWPSISRTSPTAPPHGAPASPPTGAAPPSARVPLSSPATPRCSSSSRASKGPWLAASSWTGTGGAATSREYATTPCVSPSPIAWSTHPTSTAPASSRSRGSPTPTWRRSSPIAGRRASATSTSRASRPSSSVSSAPRASRPPRSRAAGSPSSRLT